jgi:ADP-heptose:LPS heptosyltransferase
VSGHVLAVRLDSAGDVLLTGPAIRALVAGADRVTLLCGSRGREAAALLPGPSAILEHTAAWIDPEPAPVDAAALDRLVAELRALDVDAAVVFTSHHQSPLPTALLLRLAAVPFVAAISDDYPGSLLDVRHRVDPTVHEVERSLSLARAAGFPAPRGDDLALRVRDGYASERSTPFVALHPGASVPARTWPPQRFRELARVLSARGERVVVTAGPGERDLARAVAREDAEVVEPATLGELAGLLAGASALVCGNTGPAHLAAAVGTPVVSIFPPTVPAERWRPWGVPHVLLGDQEIPCAGCRSSVCPLVGHPCVGRVTAEAALAAVEALREVCASREPGARDARAMVGTGHRE